MSPALCASNSVQPGGVDHQVDGLDRCTPARAWCPPPRHEHRAGRAASRIASPAGPGRPGRAVGDAGRSIGAVLERSIDAVGLQRMGSVGPGFSPHRRGVGNTLPGVAQAVAGRTPGGRGPSSSRSSSPNIFGIEQALSRADAVLAGDRPAGVDAQLDDRLRPASRPALPRRRPRRRTAPAGGGCRRRRGRRWPTRSPALGAQLAIARSTSGSRVRGMTPSCTIVVRADPAHRRERRLAALPDRGPFGRRRRPTRISNAPLRVQMSCTAPNTASHLHRGAVQLDHQRGRVASGIPAWTAASEASMRERVHDLHGRRDDPRAR